MEAKEEKDQRGHYAVQGLALLKGRNAAGMVSI